MTKKTIKTPIPKTQERKASLSGAAVDSEARTVRAALSSETPVERIFGREVLVHTPKAVDLSRADDNGLPLLVNHDDESFPVGRVQNIGLDRDRVLRGDLVFSEATQDARDAWALVEDGTLSDVSIRYRINKIAKRESDTDDVRVTNWSLLEGSVVSVPADPSVGIGRSEEDLGGIDMPKDDESATEPTKVTPSASRNAGRDEGMRAERQRMTDIDNCAANFPDHSGVVDLTRQAKEEGWSLEHFKDEMIKEVAGAPASPSRSIVPQSPHSILPGADSMEKMQAAIVEALDFRMGNLRKDPEAETKARQNEYSSYGMIEIGRRFLEAGHISTRGMNPTDVAGAMLTRFIDPGTVPATGISTYFPDLLENVGNKALFQGFSEAPTTYQLWTGTASSRDFKPGSLPGLSHFTSLTVNAENASIADGTLEDKKEVFQVQTYAAKYALTRQALVNDDLGGFGDVARKMGVAAGRTLDEQVYAFVVANGNMNEDGNPLFDEVNHNNAPAAAGAPSTANISTARTRMGRQVDWNNVLLGIAPQYMVVPIELERQMLELQSQITGLDPDATGQMRDNIYRTMWAPVATPRLTDANDWYMFGARGEHINVVYLNDQRAPMLARDEGWSVLSAHWRVVFDFDVMAADWRSAIKFDNA